MSAAGRWGITSVVAILIAAIGWADYVTGPDIGFSLFYLVPIVAAAWFVGRNPGVTIAFVAAAAWLLADLAWTEEGLAAITHWNAFTRLVTYVVVAILTSIVKEDRDRLAALNIQLDAALQQETALARTDLLTSLSNSRRFLEHVDSELRRRQADQQAVCVAFLDIDNFKQVNDRYGHVEGDDLLRRIAAEIASAVRETDVAARMGGDEFAILFRLVSPEQASIIASRIIERIRAAGSHYPEVGLGASIGVAWFSSAPPKAEELLHAADVAMYEAKAAGKGAIRLVFGAPAERRGDSPPSQ